jgi:cation diffusion facilitator family transporter
LRSAYLHVLADAVTSLAAILALFTGKYFGAAWMDPAMGAVGSLLVARWSWGLLRDSARVLLDHQAPLELRQEITAALEADSEDRVADLHVWSIAPGLHAAEIAIVTHHPAPPSHYKARLPKSACLAHTTVEVHHCTD